jgi:hypothetical protein
VLRAKRLVKRRALPNVCNTLYIQRFAPELFADVQPKKVSFALYIRTKRLATKRLVRKRLA